MEPREYEAMAAVEAGHWWYVSLRAALKQYWNRYVPREAARWADVGCGTGGTLALLDVPAAFTTGLDASPEALELCRQSELKRLARGSVTNLPYAANSLDVVTCMDVLYHRAAGDPAQALAEIRRTLRPGGVLFLNLPAYQWLYSRHDRAIHTARRFTRKKVVALVERAGLKVLKATYWNTLLFPLAATARVLSRRDPSSTSDVKTVSGFANTTFLAVTSMERGLLRLTSLPFGLSVFVVARKN